MRVSGVDVDVRQQNASATTDTNAGSRLGGSTHVALIVLLIGAAGSLALLINAGRTGPKPLLVSMTLWVLSPFVALVVGNAMSKRWSASIGDSLRRTMVVVALASLALYSLDTVRHVAGKPAAMYVLVPPLSWLLIAIVAMSAFASDKRSRRRAEV